MFYTNDFSNSYRMGDIIEGFSEIKLNYIKNYDMFNLNIDINKCNFFSILTPCCSIEKKEALIVPLKKIEDKMLNSNYIIKDPTIINKPINKR